ncbi:MAG: hypothetical protein AAB443_00620 [Patescibacteria group bacterium]|mgnify:CR=1 FL=1
MFIFCVILFGKILDSLGRQRLFFLFAFNPTVLIHLVLEAHNEVIILFLLLGSVYMLLRRRSLIGGLLTISMILIKYYPIIILPIFILKRKKQGNKLLWTKQFFLSSLLITLLIIFSFFVIKHPNLKPFLDQNLNLRRDIGCFHRCSPIVSLTRYVFAENEGLVRTTVFVAFYLLLIYYLLIKNFMLLEFLFFALSATFFIFISWLTPWYLVLPISIGVLLSNRRSYLFLVIVLTFYSLFHYFGY